MVSFKDIPLVKPNIPRISEGERNIADQYVTERDLLYELKCFLERKLKGSFVEIWITVG